MESIAQGGIYAITGPNGIYIGSAVKFRKRWVFHKSLLRRGKHHAKHLQHAHDKYGMDALNFRVLEVVSDMSTLYTTEQRYLDTLFALIDRRRIYNVTQAADGTTGRIPTPEARQRMSAFQKGRKRDAATRQRMSEGRKGMRFSAAHCDNNALAKSGGKRYVIIAPDGTEYRNVTNLSAFAREHGAPRSGLMNVASGVSAAAKGWHLAVQITHVT